MRSKKSEVWNSGLEAEREGRPIRQTGETCLSPHSPDGRGVGRNDDSALYRSMG